MQGSVNIDIDRPIHDVFILANDHVTAWSSKARSSNTIPRSAR